MVSRETIYDWIDRGRLKMTEYAAKTWVSVKSLEEVTAPLREVP